MSSRDQDDELLAIARMMRIMTPMSAISRARVLDYVTSRCESLGMAPPRAEVRPTEDHVGEAARSAEPAPARAGFDFADPPAASRPAAPSWGGP